MLDSARLQAGLPVGGLGEPFHFLESVGSTNDDARDLAAAGAPHGALVVAEEQRAGRGRGGSRWHTPKGCALAFSLVLRPAGKPASAGLYSGLGALAVCRALEAWGLQPQVKWPNDVLLGGRKAAGVLAEATWQGADLACLVLGIGLNVKPGSLPRPEVLDFPATCVERALGRPVDREALLLAILRELAEWLPRVGEESFRRAWEARLAYRGMEVEVRRAGSVQRGRLLGLAPDGRLRLRQDDGGELLVAAGALHLRPVDKMDD